MIKRPYRAFLLITAALSLVSFRPIAPKPIIIKLATLAPVGSPWHQVLLDIGEEWRQVSDNQVLLKIYPGGVAGDDTDVVLKMRLNQLQAAGLAAQGMGLIDPSIFALTIPLLLDNYDEIQWMRSQIEDDLIARNRAAGFEILAWADIGWIYWFTKTPVRVPADLEGMRVFTWAGGPDMEKIWSALGIQSVNLAAPDILSGLQTGMIEAMFTSPLIAASYQFFGIVNHMTRMKWTIMPGAVVITTQAWGRIPADLRPKLKAIAQKHGEISVEAIRAMDDEALEVMTSYGLDIIDISPEQRQLWDAWADKHVHLLRGTLVDSTLFDFVLSAKPRMREELRAGSN